MPLLLLNLLSRLPEKQIGADRRAKNGDQLIKLVGDQLAQEFGRGFEAKNLRRMLQFAVAFPNKEKVAPLVRHLSWTHFPRGGAPERGARLGT